ncbi:MAG TPA: META domain-containing protein [Parcubacteria group bacterium]|nr:META domain-containing protein [Parcubacteria group bacterium]
MEKKYIYGLVGLGVIVVLFFLIDNLAYESGRQGIIVGETVSRSGKIVSIDTNQIAFDGPYIFSLESEAGELTTVAIPSMGLPMCEAYKAKKIGDVSLIKISDEMEVRGVVSEDGSIVPCSSGEHYFTPKGIVVENFEGEADPNRMKLTMKTWNWVNTLLNDGTTITPKIENKFSISFKEDGTFSAATDCNGVGGNYVTKDSYIVFSQMMSTLMYCEDSQESKFTEFLANTSNFHFTSKGELVLDLKFDSGSVIFR